MMFFGELGLDGRLRPVRGVLPAVAAAAGRGYGTVMVAEQNAPEAALVPGVRVIAASSLTAAVDWLRGTPALRGGPPAAEFEGGQELSGSRGGGKRLGVGAYPGGRTGQTNGSGITAAPDLADLLGQPTARRAAEVSAAGGHHLSLLGPPGAGKTMLAERIPTILPRLDTAAALEVTAIHSVAGILPPQVPLLTDPPFIWASRAPQKPRRLRASGGRRVTSWISTAPGCSMRFPPAARPVRRPSRSRRA